MSKHYTMIRVCDARKRGFVGMDMSLDISMREYGIAWKRYRNGTYWYAVGSVYDETLREYVAWNTYQLDPEYDSFDWADFADVAKCSGMELGDWMDMPYEHRIYDLYLYYGTANVFGAY